MRVIGWIGTILFYPFYLMFCIAEKCKMESWIPILYNLFVLYVFYEGYRLYQSGTETTGQFIFELALVVFAISCGYGIVTVVNYFVCIILINVLYLFSQAYQYCATWREGISMAELQGRMDAMRNQKEAVKREKMQKKEREKAQKENRQTSAEEKSRDQQERKSYQNQEHTYQSEESWTEEEMRRQQEAYQREWNRRQQEEKRRREEERQRREQREQQEQQSSTSAYDMRIQEALTFFGLNVAYTEEELNKAFRDKMKEFHPDQGNIHDEALAKELSQKAVEARELLRQELQKI